MFKFPKSVLIASVLAATLGGAAWAADYVGIGRPATPKEVAAWDIDVRPDFAGLPKGSGSVAKGQDIWEGKCASCHGVFGESNEVFSPLIGGTSKDDIAKGNVANLKRTDYPGRTTIMKVATVSTLWDYINRAMPWNAPKSLSADEVYSVTAYLLSMADIVPADFVLSDKNIAEVQKRMPNRNGMTTAHNMWPGDEFKGTKKPDTQNIACMSNCVTEAKVASFLPDHARNNHGNLAEQNRAVGAQHGVDTTKPAGSKPAPVSAAPAAASTASAAPASDNAAAKATALMQKNNCLACHGMTSKLVGPGFSDVAKKHAGKADYLADKIKAGGSGVWGAIPMPAQSLSMDDAKIIAKWLADGMPK